MKVYIVVGNNGEMYEDNVEWNDAVFASEEAARIYIQNRPSVYAKEQARIDELEELWSKRELTESEDKELHDLYKRWFFVHNKIPTYRIEEFELQE